MSYPVSNAGRGVWLWSIDGSKGESEHGVSFAMTGGMPLPRGSIGYPTSLLVTPFRVKAPKQAFSPRG